MLGLRNRPANRENFVRLRLALASLPARRRHREDACDSPHPRRYVSPCREATEAGGRDLLSLGRLVVQSVPERPRRVSIPHARWLHVEQHRGRTQPAARGPRVRSTYPAGTGGSGPSQRSYREQPGVLPHRQSTVSDAETACFGAGGFGRGGASVRVKDPSPLRPACTRADKGDWGATAAVARGFHGRAGVDRLKVVEKRSRFRLCVQVTTADGPAVDPAGGVT